jgi:predicted AAA+ superfamily ATPase
MTYQPRFLEKRLRKFPQWFKAVLVLGARQCGKTTLLRQCFPEVPVVTFDPVQDLHGARQSPDLFLDRFPPPLILDEVQYVPGLFAALKRRLDSLGKPGQYFLAASGAPRLLRQVAESLGGRVGFLELENMSVAEVAGMGTEAPWLKVWLESSGAAVPENYTVLPPDPGGFLRALWRGGMPSLLGLPDKAVPSFLGSYLRTYFEDMRMAGEIRDMAGFDAFVTLCATLTAQEINMAQLGREIGVTPATVRKWLDVLEDTHQWREIPAASGSLIKRPSGKKKGFLCDTGLACLLQRLGSVGAVRTSPLRGALFETFVNGDLRRQFAAFDVEPLVWQWRSGGAEVGSVLEWGGIRYLVEIKCKTELDENDLRGVRAFRETNAETAPAVIIYAGNVCRKLDAHTLALPWNTVPAHFNRFGSVG